MATDVSPVPADSVYGGVPSGRGTAPEGAFVMAGGVPWVGDPAKCRGKNPKGEPCGAAPVKGKPYCVGHQRSFDKRIEAQSHVHEG